MLWSTAGAGLNVSSLAGCRGDLGAGVLALHGEIEPKKEVLLTSAMRLCTALTRAGNRSNLTACDKSRIEYLGFDDIERKEGLEFLCGLITHPDGTWYCEECAGDQMAVFLVGVRSQLECIARRVESSTS